MRRRWRCARDYEGQTCSLARSLEVVGERWTLLIVRDLFFGVRRFTDLQAHLDIPRAVLERAAGLAGRSAASWSAAPTAPGRDEFLLTECGVELWPAVHALMQWGERHCSPGGARRVFIHVGCDATVGPTGVCPACGAEPPAAELEMRPGPGATPPIARRRGHARAAGAAAAADAATAPRGLTVVLPVPAGGMCGNRRSAVGPLSACRGLRQAPRMTLRTGILALLTFLLLAAPAGAVVGGSPLDEALPGPVRGPSALRRPLVAPDRVLTAAHCVLRERTGWAHLAGQAPPQGRLPCPRLAARNGPAVYLDDVALVHARRAGRRRADRSPLGGTPDPAMRIIGAAT